MVGKWVVATRPQPPRQDGRGTRTCTCVRHREISACRRTVCQAKLTACARAHTHQVYLRARDGCNTRGASAHVFVHASPTRETGERENETGAEARGENRATMGKGDEGGTRRRLGRAVACTSRIIAIHRSKRTCREARAPELDTLRHARKQLHFFPSFFPRYIPFFSRVSSFFRDLLYTARLLAKQSVIIQSR